MNLGEIANGLEMEIDRANKRLVNLIESLSGPRPEAPSPNPPKEPGTIGTLREVGMRMLDLHTRINFLEDMLLEPKGNMANKLSPPMGMAAQMPSVALRPF